MKVMHVATFLVASSFLAATATAATDHISTDVRHPELGAADRPGAWNRRDGAFPLPRPRPALDTLKGPYEFGSKKATSFGSVLAAGAAVLLSTSTQNPKSSLPLAFLLLAAPASAAEPADVSEEARIKGALFGALVADGLALGCHYEYDAPTIKKAYGGIIPTYMAPGERMGGSTHGVGWGRRNYHPGQKKGDQTDYGLYNILMAEFLASRGRRGGAVDLKKLIPQWKKFVNSKQWGAWKCTMTKSTLQQVARGTSNSKLGGHSNAMAIRGAANVAAFNTEGEAAAAERKMMFTHRNKQALDGGEFFARVTWKVAREGMTPRAAIDAAGNQMGGWIKKQVKKGIDKFEEATDPSKPLGKEEFVDDLAMTSMARLWDVGKTEPIKVGKASPTEGTMPSSIYIILKYQDDFEAAVKANAMVGGDNASRAVAVGMVLGAYHGVDAIPQYLQDGLNAWSRMDKALDAILALPGGKSEL